MKRKVNNIATKYSDRLKTLDNIEAIVVGDTSGIEVFDPYFIIDIDIYYKDEIKLPEERKALLGNPAGFETSPVYPVDRFLDNDLPVMIYYRNQSGLDSLFRRIEEIKWVFRRETANTLYRIKNGNDIYSKSDWYSGIKSRLGNIDDSFWENIIKASKFLVENSIMELGVSIFKNNSILFQNSLSDFMRNVCAFVFALNRRFEPPARRLYEELSVLTVLPDEFISRFESLCRFENEFEPERRVEIANLITRSLITLELEK